MSKIIIINNSSLPDFAAINACTQVIKSGRNAGGRYCAAVTVGMIAENDVLVVATRNSSSDTMIVTDVDGLSG